MSSWPSGPLHPAQRRYLAEELVRLRRSDEGRRSTSPHRAAKVDPNPHQIEAVIFALARLREGGCILADEVGLGKTIEAGLVIAQLKAEGARRVLLIAPKSLLGQWRQELFQLFEVEAREGSSKPGALDGDGVFLINREAAGSENGQKALAAAAPFDLCVIDEAHEVFAGIYKRYTQAGDYNASSEHARTAGRVREVLGRTPVLLLTATPIQNNLAELWGLVQYVDPLGTLLGDLPTFRAVFCGADDRQVAPGQEDELRSRLKQVLQRTLRRQAQSFLEKPFVNREARLFEYAMSEEERALYDDVTAYILEPGIIAFQGRHRQLLLIGFHRRMASSTAALRASLERVAGRLQRMLEGVVDPDEPESDLEELEEVVEEGPARSARAESRAPAEIQAEQRRVLGFVERARKIAQDDSKFRALHAALTFVSGRARAGQGSDRVVIFTESLVTQASLRERLISSGVVTDDEVTLLSGQNESPRAKAALARWREEVPAHPEPSVHPEPPVHPERSRGGSGAVSTEIAVRLALVHEFKTRSRVFISTEAGAKGLNLQFCNTVVNYDLPWNPQRIEQRIGRCHRYGQQHDVTVINFLAKDNETQRLTFDILSQKLELFGTVLDASDQVLHRGAHTSGEVLVSAIGAEFEGELRRIYERARTVDEVHDELRALRDRVAEERRRFEETSARTASVLAERFDEEVQQVFRGHQARLPAALAELDADLLRVVTGDLDARAVTWKASQTGAGSMLEFEGAVHGPLHVSHPLVVAAVNAARAESRWPAVSVKMAGVKKGPARLRLVKLGVDGFERVEQLLPVVVCGDGEVLDAETALRLLQTRFAPLSGSLQFAAATRGGSAFAPDPGPPSPRGASPPFPASQAEGVMGDAVEQAVFFAQAEIDSAEHHRFERATIQGERFVEDRLLVLRQRKAALAERFELATQRRDGATGSEAREDAERARTALQQQLDGVEEEYERLARRDDPRFQQHQAHIQQRRYAPPRLETLFDLDLVIE
ncbi:MAG: SNF2-related protein [Archangium sp.]|nr:SNF2-related protein [Archangium sp.]